MQKTDLSTYRTACGGAIIVTPKAKAHLLAHPEVTAHLSSAIAEIRLPAAGFLRAEVDLRKSVGHESCVETESLQLDEPALFALRIGREKPSRIAPPGTIGQETPFVSVLAFQSRTNPREYVCATAWVGRLAEKEPWDPQIRNDEERQACLRFWTSHALIHDPSVMSAAFSSTWRDVLAA